MNDLVPVNPSPISIFDVPADIARAYYDRGYMPAQIEQHLAHQAVRARLYREPQLRLAAPKLQGPETIPSRPEITKIPLPTWGLRRKRDYHSNLQWKAHRAKIFEILADFESREQPPIEPPKIRSDGWRAANRMRGAKLAAEVAATYGLTLTQIRSRTNFLEFTIPRHEAMYRLRRELLMSLPDIARVLRRDDHSTVWSAVRAHARRVAALKAKAEAST